MAVVTSLHFDSLDEPLRSLKLSLLKDLKDAYTTWQSSTDTPIPVSFLRACRLYHSDHLEVYFSRAPKRSLQDHFSAIISPQNELRVLTFLRKTIAQVADETLQSSLTEALQLLADAYLSHVPKSTNGKELKDDASVALELWAQSNGYVSHVALADFEDTGRGMALSSAVEAGKPLIECDAGVFMSIFAAEKSTLGPHLAQLDTLDDDSKLILFVIHEKFVNPTSFWRPYLELLPEVIDSALYFDENDLEYLNGTHLAIEIRMTLEHLRESYGNIMTAVAGMPQVFDPIAFSWERFRWTRAIFDSRGFNLTLKGRARNCLLPYIDSLNTTHYTHLQARGLVDESRKGTFSDLGTYSLPTVGALHSSQVGHQAFLNYGGFSTRELVLFYGFAFEDENPYDTFNLSLDPPEDKMAEARLNLVSKLGITTEHYLSSSSLSNDLLYYFSLVLLPASLIALAAKRPVEDLRKLLFTPAQVKSVKKALSELIETLIDNMKTENPHLSAPPAIFPSNRAKLGLLYARNQLRILESSLNLVLAWTGN